MDTFVLLYRCIIEANGIESKIALQTGHNDIALISVLNASQRQINTQFPNFQIPSCICSAGWALTLVSSWTLFGRTADIDCTLISRSLKQCSHSEAAAYCKHVEQTFGSKYFTLRSLESQRRKEQALQEPITGNGALFLTNFQDLISDGDKQNSNAH